MLTQSDIQNTLLQAKFIASNVILNNITAEMGGNLDVDWYPAIRWYLNITSLQQQFNIQNYNDPNTVSIFNCLNKLIGLNMCDITVDPNFQSLTGNIISITNNIFNSSAPLLFNNVTTFSLTNYQGTFFSLYGNNPNLILVTEDTTGPTPIWQQDTATVPIYVYQTPGDPTTPLLSVTWTWGAPTTGYIIISGLKP